MNRKSEALMLMSGGIDSTACAIYFQNRDFRVRGLFIDYGHPVNSVERKFVSKLSAELDIELKIVCIDGFDHSGDGEIVGRNAMFIFAALMKVTRSTTVIGIGIHAGTPYYDCGPMFLTSINKVVTDSTAGTVTVDAPFLELEKPQVYSLAKELGVPIDMTYSCEVGVIPSCGKCLSCKDREHWFAG